MCAIQTDKQTDRKSDRDRHWQRTDNATRRMAEMTPKEKMKLLKREKESGDPLFFFLGGLLRNIANLMEGRGPKKVRFFLLEGALWSGSTKN